ncbi:hypothetical protein ACOMHN_066999 [Nucella lapillus]
MAGTQPLLLLLLLFLLLLAWNTLIVNAQCRSGPDLCGQDQNACMVGGVPYCCIGQFMTLTMQGDKIITCRCRTNNGVGSQCTRTYHTGNNASSSFTSASWMTCALVSVVGVFFFWGGGVKIMN